MSEHDRLMAKITSHDENSNDAHLVLVRVANDQNVAMILCKVLDGLVVISNVGYKDREISGSDINALLLGGMHLRRWWR